MVAMWDRHPTSDSSLAPRRAAALGIAWAAAAMVAVIYYCAVYVDEWDSGARPSGLLIEPLVDDADAVLRLAPAVGVPLRCSLQLAGIDVDVAQRALRELTAPPHDAKDRHCAARCHGSIAVQQIPMSSHVASTVGLALDTLLAKTSLPTHSATKSAAGAPLGEDVRILLLPGAPHDGANHTTGASSPRCISRRESSTATTVVCVARRGGGLGLARHMQQLRDAAQPSSMPRTRSALRSMIGRVASTRRRGLRHLVQLVEELLVELGIADDNVIDAVRQIGTMLTGALTTGAYSLPTAELLNDPSTTAPTRRTLLSHDGENQLDAARLTPSELASVLQDPAWLVELQLPPEQWVALHLPLYLPLAVGLLSATFGTLRALLRPAFADVTHRALEQQPGS